MTVRRSERDSPQDEPRGRPGVEPSDDTYRSVMQSLYDGVYFVDLERRIQFWNRSAERLSGYPGDQVVGCRCQDNLLDHVDDEGHGLCLGRCPLQASMEDGEIREAKVYLRHREGHRVPVVVRTAPIRDGGGEIIGGVEIFNGDERLLSAMDDVEDLRRLVDHDPLTGLGNRRFLEDSLSARTSEWRRHSIPFSVLIADIDHFKRFNDTWGHEVGDLALVTVARTLSSNARAGDHVVRWGGEEFVVVLGHTGEDRIGAAAERLRSLVAESGIRAAGRELAVTVSVGGATCREGESTEDLLKRADRSLLRAKRDGRNRVVIDSGAAAPAAAGP